MICRWGVSKEPTIGETGLSYPWLFAVISCRAFFIRCSEEGQYKLRSTSTGSILFANPRSNVISFLCSKDFWLGWGKRFCLERKVQGLVRNCFPSKCVKKTWFQDKHWDTLAHWIWPRILSKHFISLLTPQPDVFCRLAYQSRASKHKNWKELDRLKLYLKVINKS